MNHRITFEKEKRELFSSDNPIRIKNLGQQLFEATAVSRFLLNYDSFFSDDDDVIFHPDLGDDVSQKWYDEIQHWSFKTNTSKSSSNGFINYCHILT